MEPDRLEVLHEVQSYSPTARASLLYLCTMRPSYGSSLPMGRKLRWLVQSQALFDVLATRYYRLHHLVLNNDHQLLLNRIQKV